jgi:Rieske Fe-S protein
MQRRDFLKWAVHGLGAVFGAVLGVPAVAYLIDARNRPVRAVDFRTVARLSDLEREVPKEVVIRETRADAWTLHPDTVIGRVWLIRHTDANDVDSVTAFTTICPHLGCSVNWQKNITEQGGGHFACPCHGGKFKKDGERLHDAGSTNPAPRDLDTLQVKIEPDPADSDQKLVKVRFVRFKTFQEKKEPELNTPETADV